MSPRAQILYSCIGDLSNSPSSLPGWVKKANTFEIVVHIIYHQYKYSLRSRNNLNLRIQNGTILANFYTNRLIETTNENTWLTKSEYLDRCKENRHVRTEEYRQLMYQNKWTQAELARQLGVSRAWVSKVMRF